MGADQRERLRGGGTEPAMAELEGCIFMCHFNDTELKLTAKPKALLKPFGKTIIEPFLKAYNAKQSAADQLTLNDVEKVMAGPGFPYRSDVVPDLAVTVKSLIPPAMDDEGQPLDKPMDTVRVDLMQKKERSVKIICCGVNLEAELPAKFVTVSLGEGLIADFFNKLNQAHKTNLSLTDVTRVTVKTNGEDVEVKVGQPSWEVLPRAGRTDVTIFLTEFLTADMAVKFPPPKPEEPKPVDQVFRVRCDAVELKLTLSAKQLSKSLRDGIVTPFLKAYAKKAARPGVTADDVTRVEADGLAVSDSLKLQVSVPRGT